MKKMKTKEQQILSMMHDLNIEVPLKIRLQTTIVSYCLHEMEGHIFMAADESSEQYKEQFEKNAEIMKFAQPLIDWVNEELDNWKKDGCP